MKTYIISAIAIISVIFWGHVDGQDAQDKSMSPTILIVKLHDDLPVRISPGTGRLVPTGAQVRQDDLVELNDIPASKWERVHASSSDADLARFRARGRQLAGKELPDLAVEFFLVLEDIDDTTDLLANLRNHPFVEDAYLQPDDSAPTPGNFEPNQTYLNNSSGIGAQSIWAIPGTSGAWVNVAVLEKDFHQGHADYGNVLVLGPKGGTVSERHHGTATMGIIASKSNHWGTTGIAYASRLIFSGIGSNIADAITRTFPHLQYGDVILIERQVNINGVWQPVEAVSSNLNAVKTAIANGFVVIVPAANGTVVGGEGRFLDQYGGPFLRQNDSGAIYVGAGAPPNIAQPAYSRLAFSNFGSRVDVQAQGSRVWTTGYGDAYSALGEDYYYTSTYSGTSSASAIVAGAVALLQSAYVQRYGTRASPRALRHALVETGVSQTNYSGDHIGPHLQLPEALELPIPPVWINAQDQQCYGMGAVSWSVVPTATSYELQGYDATNNFYLAYSGSGTTHQVQVSEETFYRARACASGSCGAWSFLAGPINFHPICI